MKGHIALLLDKPENSRQVGNALKKESYIIPKLNENLSKDHPDYIDLDTLPWWRVILKSGKISPREANGQFEQAELLRRENVQVLEGLFVDLEQYGWFPDQVDYYRVKYIIDKVFIIIHKYIHIRYRGA